MPKKKGRQLYRVYNNFMYGAFQALVKESDYLDMKLIIVAYLSAENQ